MRLHTTTLGDGPRTIGLVHGLGGNAAMWSGLAHRIVGLGGRRVVAVDLRGHGLSPRADRYGVEDLAQDLVETLPTGMDVLVGHSLGGTVVSRAVERLAPDRAVYLDPGFRLGLPVDGWRGRLLWAAPRLMLPLVAFLGSRGRRPILAREDELALVLAKQQWDHAMAVDVFREVAHSPLDIADPVVPSTVVVSDDGHVVMAGDTIEELAAHHWEVRRLEGVGHDLFLEDLDRTMASIEDLV